MNTLSTDISPVSPWERAEELSNEAFPLLFKITSGNPVMGSPMYIEPYVLNEYFHTENRIFLYTHPTKKIQVGGFFFTPDSKSEEDFMLSLHTSKFTCRLCSDQIIEESRVFSDNSKKYECHWKPEGEAGNLIFYRCDISDDVFATYEFKNSFAKRVHCDESQVSLVDAHTMCRNLPDNLINVTQIRGRTIPHLIKYREKAEQILKRAHLKEFLDVCRDHLRSTNK